MRYIGDVHGKMEDYMKIISNCDASVQVGDFGYGFLDIPYIPLEHRQIRGNHDNLDVCCLSPNWIPDCTVENDIFYMGGAYSIDRDMRHVGNDVWDNEELGYVELGDAIDLYSQIMPRVMITHDGPEDVMLNIFGRSRKIGSRTGGALQSMLEIHQPELWIFGHWHRSCNQIINKTQFICLSELEYIDIPTMTNNLKLG